MKFERKHITYIVIGILLLLLVISSLGFAQETTSDGVYVGQVDDVQTCFDFKNAPGNDWCYVDAERGCYCVPTTAAKMMTVFSITGLPANCEIASYEECSEYEKEEYVCDSSETCDICYGETPEKYLYMGSCSVQNMPGYSLCSIYYTTSSLSKPFTCTVEYLTSACVDDKEQEFIDFVEGKDTSSAFSYFFKRIDLKWNTENVLVYGYYTMETQYECNCRTIDEMCERTVCADTERISIPIDELPDGADNVLCEEVAEDNICAGVVCEPKCSDTDYLYNGHCVNGYCEYDKIPDADQCGGYECDETCEPKCDGSDYYFNPSCIDGECQYDIEFDSQQCESEFDGSIYMVMLAVVAAAFIIISIVLVIIGRAKR